jgi:hypothetical protein
VNDPEFEQWLARQYQEPPAEELPAGEFTRSVLRRVRRTAQLRRVCLAESVLLGAVIAAAVLVWGLPVDVAADVAGRWPVWLRALAGPGTPENTVLGGSLALMALAAARGSRER